VVPVGKPSLAWSTEGTLASGFVVLMHPGLRLEMSEEEHRFAHGLDRAISPGGRFPEASTSPAQPIAGHLTADGQFIQGINAWLKTQVTQNLSQSLF
jgi:hypothetical protein